MNNIFFVLWVCWLTLVLSLCPFQEELISIVKFTLHSLSLGSMYVPHYWVAWDFISQNTCLKTWYPICESLDGSNQDAVGPEYRGSGLERMMWEWDLVASPHVLFLRRSPVWPSCLWGDGVYFPFRSKMCPNLLDDQFYGCLCHGINTKGGGKAPSLSLHECSPTTSWKGSNNSPWYG